MTDPNEAINALFRGIVFTSYNFFFSLARLLTNPVRGSFFLIRRLRLTENFQTPPYVFVFISFFIALALPRYFAQLQSFYVEKYPWSSVVTSSVANAYTTALQIFEPHLLIALSISCLFMNVLLDGAVTLYSLAFLRTRPTRRLFKEVILYIAGLQAALITVALIVVFFHFRGWAWSSLEEYKQSAFFSTFEDVLNASLRLSHGKGLVVDLAVAGFGVVIFAYGLAQPAFAIHRFMRGSRLTPIARRLHCEAFWIASAALFAVVTICYYEAGNWLSDQIKPDQPTLPVITSVRCTVTRDRPAHVVALTGLQNPTAQPMIFYADDFNIVLRFDITPAEVKRRETLRRANRRRAAALANRPFKIIITDSSQGSGRPALLLSPGQALWAQVRTVQPIHAFPYVSPHGDDDSLVHCGVWLVNEDIKPLQAFGSIGDEDSDRWLTVSDLNARSVSSRNAITPKRRPHNPH
jgi:hypothetical protein